MGKVIQEQFIEFHNIIRLDVNDNKEVIKKRDMLIEEIKTAIKKICEEKGIKLVRFTPFNQGSYAMGTGNKPMYDEDDYDIDCGLLFEIDKGDYRPLQIKTWVYDALNTQFRTVEWKKACIRVQYVEEGLPKFHVDFACYADANSDGKTYLAKGTPTSTTDNKKWEESKPTKLKDLINNKYSDVDESNQFKRAIRFMKRWKDYQFDSVNGKPTGIALTALAYNGFVPSIKDSFTRAIDINDLKATKDFVDYILNQFSWWDSRIKVHLPVPPENDLFEKMTDQQCKNLKTKLEKLRDTLEDAENEADPFEACKILRKQFGKDFPVPAKETTGQNRKLAVAGTSESA
ncbi:MAG: nucleotidyltransferase [Chitinophagaceae bacterium]|nr:nucleotidyltransferase [Chitinophagaceae bacterium]